MRHRSTVKYHACDNKSAFFLILTHLTKHDKSSHQTHKKTDLKLEKRRADLYLKTAESAAVFKTTEHFPLMLQRTKNRVLNATPNKDVNPCHL